MNSLIAETLRYLGCQDSTSPQILSLVQSCIDEINTVATPRSIYLELDIIRQGDTINIATFKTNSKSLRNHLKDCEKAILFAATLGVDVDNLARKAAIIDMSRAVALQAAAAAIIEEYCDKVCVGIATQSTQMKLTSRFSPGYGDLELDCQQSIINILNGKRIGLTCTNSMMLAPSKSITAIIGAGKNASCAKHKCENCNKTDCSYRKE